MKRIFCLIFACALFYTGTSMAQSLLTAACHQLRADSISFRVYPWTDPGLEGEHIVWDFSHLDSNEGKETYAKISVLSDKMRYSSEGMIGTFMPYADSLVLCRKESPDFTMNYTDPVSYFTFPFVYGNQWQDEFHGKGEYEGVYIMKEDGQVSTCADAYGTLILSETDTMHEVTRLKIVTNSAIEVENKYEKGTIATLQKTADIYLWFARGYRYPLASQIRETISTDGHTQKQTALCRLIPLDCFDSMDDSFNEEIRNQTSHTDTSEYPIRDLILGNMDGTLNVAYTLETDAAVCIRVADPAGVVYIARSFNENGGGNYSHEISLAGLKKSQYLIYIGANGIETCHKINIR